MSALTIKARPRRRWSASTAVSCCSAAGAVVVVEPELIVSEAEQGLRALLIDWDHVGVGPISYDLSTFLYRFPPQDRQWILNCYQEAVGRVSWRLPCARDLNLLFETAESARYANRAIWPAIALLQERAEWGFDELAAVEQWFELLEPVLSV